ncbi:hypothetical protein Tco_1015538 [Tanacetum coccineum]|uniref:Uncharacterized protein n=1 Tax=Tanacetum coccineum TaxID=301880 RepID=A0ABQ5FM71_9ASTR
MGSTKNFKRLDPWLLLEYSRQFQKFIKPRISLNDENGIMACKYFLEYTKLEVQQFRDTLIKHMESVKKLIDERAQHKREYDNRDRNSSSGNDVDADDVEVKPIYDKEPMAEVQMTDEINVFAIGQQHTEQPEFNNKGETGRIFKTVALKWVPTRKIFTSSKTTIDSEPPHGSNTDITNLHECIQTLDSSASTSINVQEEKNLDLSADTPSNLKKERIKACIKENVISGRPRLHGIALIQEMSARRKSQRSPPHTLHGITLEQSQQGVSNDVLHSTVTNGNPSRVNLKQLCGRLLASFQDNAKYEHVGQVSRSQDSKDNKDKQGKDLRISEQKTKSKDNDKGSRS